MRTKCNPRSPGVCRGPKPWNRRIQKGAEQKAERQEQRDRDRERYGHSWGFLHEVPDQAVTDRQVAGEIARWQREKAG